MVTEAQTSPVIKPATSPKLIASKTDGTMDFPDAMREVIAGNRVSKREWDNPLIVVYLDGHLRINLEDGVHNLIVSEGDMIGQDWFVVDSPTS